MEELKNQLTQISQQLTNVASSKATCDKLVESGQVRVVDSNPEQEDPQNPPTLTIGSQEAVRAMLNPIIRQLDTQRERLLNAKEQVLNQITEGVDSTEETSEEQTAETEGE